MIFGIPFFDRRAGLFDVALFVFVQLIFILIILNVSTDIQAHLAFVRDFINGEKSSLPGNFLLYLILYLFSFISDKTFFMLPLLSFILTCSVLAKYYISKQIMLSELRVSYHPKQISLTAAALIFLFSVPIGLLSISQTFYLGYFPPNVWHNSTTIFVMPFALLLFYFATLQIKNYKNGRMWLILSLTIINAFAKPSYLFVFFIVYPIFSLLKYKLTKTFFHSLIPIFAGTVVVLGEYLVIYQLNGTTGDGVAINPLFFYVNHLISDSHEILQLLIFLLGSFIFPIVMLMKNPGILHKNVSLQFALWSSIIGLIIFYLFTETGSRLTHGNFQWQVVISNYILFFVLTLNLLKLVSENNFNIKKFLPETAAFSLHFLSGAVYLIYMLLSKSYH